MVHSNPQKDLRSATSNDESQIITRFPESFQRSALMHDDSTPDSDLPTSPYPSSPSPLPSDEHRQRSMSPPFRFRRNSVMRLENLLNTTDPIENSMYRSRSLDMRPTEPEFRETFTPPSSVDDSTPKKKKVKMHYCAECSKGFPRPSGLRTHMNTHTNERPYLCAFPGCTRAFSVVSNAKRHMKTHGMGITGPEFDPGPDRYVVGFEDPVILEPSGSSKAKPALHEPMRLRWISSEIETGRGKRPSVDFDPNFMQPSGSLDTPGTLEPEA